jgi:hypothetical protein
MVLITQHYRTQQRTDLAAVVQQAGLDAGRPRAQQLPGGLVDADADGRRRATVEPWAREGP